jgi:hypothetical protein
MEGRTRPLSKFENRTHDSFLIIRNSTALEDFYKGLLCLPAGEHPTRKRKSLRDGIIASMETPAETWKRAAGEAAAKVLEETSPSSRHSATDPLPVTIEPEEDARLPILEARIERDRKAYRRGHVKALKAQGPGTLEREIKSTALLCVRVLHQYEERGLGADQAREVVQELIIPQPDR